MMGQNDFLATWNFDNMTPAVSSITGSGADDVNGEDVLFGPGVTVPTPNPPGRYPQGNPSSGLAYSGAGWTFSTTLNANDYLQCCVNTDPGTVFDPGTSVGFVFDNRRSSTGPTGYEVLASANNFSSFSNIGTGSFSGTSFVTTGPFTYTIPPTPVTTRVCFRVYGYGASNAPHCRWSTRLLHVCFRVYGYGASNAAGTLRFDNIQISSLNALPVTWLSFEARATDGGSIALDWATATETQNDYFAVERSADGARFTEIGRVPGAGNSTTVQTYAFRDENPLPGLNYYRLRQVDADGQYAFSRTVAVTTSKNAPALTIAPNPAAEFITVQFAQVAEAPVQWLLADASGRVLRSGTADTERFDLPVSDLAAGVYVLQVVAATWTNGVMFIRK
jgi:hypothetical protein